MVWRLSGHVFCDCRAKDVSVPAGSIAVFPPAHLSDDLIAIYTFLHDLSAPLGAAKMQLDDVRCPPQPSLALKSLACCARMH